MSNETIKELQFKLEACEIESTALNTLNDALAAEIRSKQDIINELADRVFQYEQVINHFVDEHNLQYETRH